MMANYPAASAGSAEMWGRYWKAGTLHSCACAFRDNYEGATAAFWAGQFSRLPVNAVLVDIGTGNGAIPLLAKAAALASNASWDLHGVDLAPIDPPASIADGVARFAGITFHPQTSLTELPFASGSVDLVTGQFAFEYAPREASIAEVTRVIGKRGRAAFVLHARESAILQTTAGQLESCRILFESSEFYQRARALAALMSAARTPEQRSALSRNAVADSKRRQFNQAAQTLTDRVAVVQTPDLLRLAMGQVSEVLRNSSTWGEARCLQALQSSEAALRDEWQRLIDLDAAALTLEQANQLRMQFESLGYTASKLDRLDHTPDLQLGWTLTIER